MRDTIIVRFNSTGRSATRMMWDIRIILQNEGVQEWLIDQPAKLR